MPADVEFVLDMGTGRGPFPVTPRQLANIGNLALIEMRRNLMKIGDQMIAELKTLYAAHDRQRIDGEPGLMQRLERALKSQLLYIPAGEVRELEMRVFDLEQIYRATSNTGKGEPPYPGWFAMMEDRSKGRHHSSRWYGFLPYDLALKLADECAQALKLSPKEKQELIDHVHTYMRGRHGDGIMTRLESPVFFQYPQFGLAIDHGVVPHPGFTAWNIFQELMRGPKLRPGGPYSPQDAFTDALKTTADRVARGDYK